MKAASLYFNEAIFLLSCKFIETCTRFVGKNVTYAKREKEEVRRRTNSHHRPADHEYNLEYILDLK